MITRESTTTRLLWAPMRTTVLEHFPAPPGVRAGKAALEQANVHQDIGPITRYLAERIMASAR